MNENSPALIIINGASATGKTVLGNKIAEEFNLPIIIKDEFKELMFDNLGWSDLNWSNKLGKTSIQILWLVAGKLLATGNSVIVETKFNPILAEKDINLLSKLFKFNTLQILCYAKGEELLERFKKRSLSNRHPGHRDAENLHKYDKELQKGKLELIKISGKTIEIDTTDFDKIDYQTIREEIKSVLNG